MTLARLLPLVGMLSMAGILLSAALQASFGDLSYLLRRPSLLARSLLAMNVIMPLLAYTMAMVFDLDRPLEMALIALAIGPVPPILPGKQLRAGGSRAYTMGLVLLSCCVAIVFVPLAAAILGRLADRPLAVSPGAVAGVVVNWMLLPLLLGIALRAWAPRVADRLARPIAQVSAVLLVLVLVPVLVKEWPYVVHLVGNFTLAAIVVFVAAGLVVGHLLGGPDPQERTVLALSTATRHPGVAMLLLHQTQEEKPVLLAAVLLVLVIGALASLPYVRMRSRSAIVPEGLTHGGGHA